MKIRLNHLFYITILLSCHTSTFQKKEKLQAISFIPANDFLSNTEKKSCDQWTHKKISINEFIKVCQPCTQEDCFRQFENLPCALRGKLIRFNRDTADYEINAGGWIKISFTDTVQYFCASKKKAKALFLANHLD